MKSAGDKSDLNNDPMRNAISAVKMTAGKVKVLGPTATVDGGEASTPEVIRNVGLAGGTSTLRLISESAGIFMALGPFSEKRANGFWYDWKKLRNPFAGGCGDGGFE